MGAAPVVSAAPELQRKGYTIPGIVILDVVEGSVQIFACVAEKRQHYGQVRRLILSH